MVPADPAEQLTHSEWEALLRHCEKNVRNRLWRLGFPAEIIEESLLSTVLKIVERQAEGLELRRETLLAFLWQTAYHCAIDLTRKLRRESPLVGSGDDDEPPMEVVSPMPDPEREAIARSDVNRCLDKLPQTERSIVLHRSYGRSAREVMCLLGIKSEASVNTRYSQACKLLRLCLESSGSYLDRKKSGVDHGVIR
jgi:DNA-directed RNA polymerase specialized sigma24 family protein